MQNYEITYLTKEEDLGKVVATLITEHEGKIISEENLGKKRLAYPIKKEEFANFYTIKFTAQAVNAITIANLIQGNANVLRHLIVTKKALTALAPERKESDKKKVVKDEVKTELKAVEVPTESKEVVIEKSDKPAVTKSKKTPKLESEKPASTKKTAAPKANAKETEDRLAALDEKLDEILKD